VVRKHGAWYEWKGSSGGGDFSSCLAVMRGVVAGEGAFAYVQGTWGVTSSYNSVVPVGLDTCLVVHDRSAVDKDGLESRDVVGTFFALKRK